MPLHEVVSSDLGERENLHTHTIYTHISDKVPG